MASSIYRQERKKNYRTMEADGEGSWKLTNIGAIGGDDDKKARAEAAATEADFANAGESAGLQVWRVEKFEIEDISEALRAGNLSLYSGDAYLVLYTSEEDDGTKAYNLHYWIGDESTQDEAGAIAYYAVALDDFLGQKPVQYRETQDEETALFHSYFKSVVYLNGGIDSGFKAVEPETYAARLLRMSGSGKSVRVKQVEMDASLINTSDVFLLDLGLTVYQFNAPHASVFERRRAMEIVQQDIKVEREDVELVIVDGEEELLACEPFWAAIGGEAPAQLARSEDSRAVASLNDDVDLTQPKCLYKISDDGGDLRVTRIQSEQDSLSSGDVNSDDVWAVSVDGRAYFYVGAGASQNEKIAVRMHAPAMLEAMQLPRFAPSTIISPNKCDTWDSIFSA